MLYGKQQLLWQKQVTVIGSIDLDFQIDEYETRVAQFRHAICKQSWASSNLRCAQVNSASYSSLDEKRVVAYGLRGEGLE